MQEAAREPLAVDPTPALSFSRRGKDVVDEATSMFTQWLEAEWSEDADNNSLAAGRRMPSHEGEQEGCRGYSTTRVVVEHQVYMSVRLPCQREL